jgi:hypothetical protein
MLFTSYFGVETPEYNRNIFNYISALSGVSLFVLIGILIGGYLERL